MKPHILSTGLIQYVWSFSNAGEMEKIFADRYKTSMEIRFSSVWFISKYCELKLFFNNVSIIGLGMEIQTLSLWVKTSPCDRRAETLWSQDEASAKLIH